MQWLSAALKELFSLFVDDVPYTLALIAWIIAGTVLLPLLELGAAPQAAILFLGFAVILFASVLITARRSRSH